MQNLVAVLNGELGLSREGSATAKRLISYPFAQILKILNQVSMPKPSRGQERGILADKAGHSTANPNPSLATHCLTLSIQTDQTKEMSFLPSIK
jgi:hypothetical protein